MPFSQISLPSSSPTESTRLIYTSVSLLLSRTQGYCYHLSKFHIESVLMRWMKLEPIIQSEVSQKEKHQYSIFLQIFYCSGRPNNILEIVAPISDTVIFFLVSIAISSSSWIFSSAISSLKLISSRVLFRSNVIVFIFRSQICIFINVWNVVLITVLISLLANPIICLL